MDNIFRAKRVTVSPEEVSAMQERVTELDADLAEATGTELTPDLDYGTHAKAVKDLTDRIIDIFEQTDYSTTVALDAIEAVLRGGVQLSMGEDAGRLLERHLRRFHAELATLQIISLIANTMGGAKKQSLEDLIKEMEATANEARDKSKS
jgi:chemotaxis regulatin CheY-phosphate phosphatase CheZ